MFKRIFALSTLVALAYAPLAVHAEEKEGPTFILRLQSVEKTLALAEYAAGLAGAEGDQLKQGLMFAKLFIGDKGIEGIDTKRPFVVYASLAEAVQESQVVVMAPIIDQEAVLDFLKKREMKTVEKDGVYSVDIPNIPVPLFFRFANKYAYVTAQNRENIDEKKLAKPSEIIGKDSGVLSLGVRVDRLSDQMKKFALGFVEQQLAEAKQHPIPNETPSIKTLKDQAVDTVASAVKSLLFDSKEFSVKIEVDPKKDEFALQFDLSAIDGSDLSKNFSSWKTGKSVVAGALLEKAAVALAVNAGLPASVKKALDPVIDELVKMGLNMAPGEYQELLEPLVKAVTPTLKAAEFDGGFALMGPNAKKLYTYVQVGKVHEGLKMEKAIKDLIKKIPGAENFFTADAETLGDFKVHLVKMPDIDENARKMFGDSAEAHIAFRDDIMVLAVGPDYQEAMKMALLAKPGEAQIAKFSVNGSKLVDLIEANDPATAKLARDAFAKNPEAETFYVTIEAGSTLKTRIAVKGQAIKFALAMNKKDAKQKNPKPSKTPVPLVPEKAP